MRTLYDDDLTPEERKNRIAYLRSLSDSERSHLATEMAEADRRRIIEELRESHPEYDDEQLRLALFERFYGKELVDLIGRDRRPLEERSPRIEELLRAQRNCA
jgi:hypothetical protein